MHVRTDSLTKSHILCAVCVRTDSPECHDIVSAGVDSDGKVPDCPHRLHLGLAVCPVHMTPVPLVVLQFFSDLKLARVTAGLGL